VPKTRAIPFRCLPSGHLDDATILINRHNRDDATIRKKYVFEGAIRIQQDLTVLAGNLFKRRHQSVKILGWQREQKSIARPIRWTTHTL
jgi:hypothetical protein